MRRFAEDQQIATGDDQWPLPEAVPTFWFGESFHRSKARHVFLDGRGELTSATCVRRMPDIIDATHFRDAAYVHILVTNDANFTAVASGAQTDLTIMTLTDFAVGLRLARPI